MTKDEVTDVLAEEIRTNDALRRKLGMSDGDASNRLDAEPAVGFTDGDGETHFITVETV